MWFYIMIARQRMLEEKKRQNSQIGKQPNNQSNSIPPKQQPQSIQTKETKNEGTHSKFERTHKKDVKQQEVTDKRQDTLSDIDYFLLI